MNAKQERAMQKVANQRKVADAKTKAEEMARTTASWANYVAERARGEMLDAMTGDERPAFLAAERAGRRA